MKLARVAILITLPLLGVIVGAAVLRGSNAQAAGGITTAQSDWPPIHEDLSRSAVDSTYADIEVLDGVVVVVWTEGESAQKVPGSIKMMWKFQGSDWQASTGADLPVFDTNNKYSYPALALERVSPTSVKAHMTWIHHQGDESQVEYKVCTLYPSSSTCSQVVEAVSDQDNSTRSAPDIAVDPFNVPHVVWSETGANEWSHIYYNNRVGDNWGKPWSINSTAGAAKEVNPAIAVIEGEKNNYVYVAWDDNYENRSTAGIWAARRDGLDATGDTEAGERAKWTKRRLSSPPYDLADTELDLADGWPAVAVDTSTERLYVMWQRLVDKSTAGDPHCYQHTLSYRVLTGTYFADDWWPGGSGMDWISVFTSTTHVPVGLGGVDDLYSGLRPSIQVISNVLHVVWQHDTTGSCGGGGGQEVASIRISGEGDLWPFVVDYGYSDHSQIPPGEGEFYWVTMTLATAKIQDRFFTNPDLGIELIDGKPQLHVALQNRIPVGSDYGWDVWYLNDKEFHWIYLPLTLKNAP